MLQLHTYTRTLLCRYESLRHCKWVDEVIPDSPWVLTDAFLAEHDIDFVCHDALPYQVCKAAFDVATLSFPLQGKSRVGRIILTGLDCRIQVAWLRVAMCTPIFEKRASSTRRSVRKESQPRT